MQLVHLLYLMIGDQPGRLLEGVDQRASGDQQRQTEEDQEGHDEAGHAADGTQHEQPAEERRHHGHTGLPEQ